MDFNDFGMKIFAGGCLRRPCGKSQLAGKGWAKLKTQQDIGDGGMWLDGGAGGGKGIVGYT